jgi:hypothetical protein
VDAISARTVRTFTFFTFVSPNIWILKAPIFTVFSPVDFISDDEVDVAWGKAARLMASERKRMRTVFILAYFGVANPCLSIRDFGAHNLLLRLIGGRFS